MYTAGGAVTPKILVRPPFLYRTLSGLLTPRQAAGPHGWKLTEFYFNYVIAIAGATSVDVVFTTETAQANNVARAAASTTPLGAPIYQNPPGTVVTTLPVATQAAPYVCRIVPTTPVFITTERQMLTVELQLSLPNTTAFTITELSFHFSMAEY